MPGRRIRSMVAAYLGPTCEGASRVGLVVQRCRLGKMLLDVGLTDFDPLVVVMHLVAVHVRRLGLSLATANGRQVWREALRIVQEDNGVLEHNTFLPCRTCDQAFEPAIDDVLLELFLAWDESGAVGDLLAIHRCPACGGRLRAKRTMRYQGDVHTPPPGTVKDDGEWARRLLQHSGG